MTHREMLESLLARYRAHEAESAGETFIRTEVGSLMRRSFFTRYKDWRGVLPLHDTDEELFEILVLLQSIDEANGSWTMAEIGAGWGRWLIGGAIAAQRVRGIPCKLIAVEAENTRFEMLLQHFADNHIDPRRHRLIKGAASERDGKVWFTQGHSEEWYGQSILPRPDSGFGNHPSATVTSVPSYSLETILGSVGKVDLIDMDVQGAELDVVRGGRDILKSKVRRLHIGTHNHELEEGLRCEMRGIGWQCICDYPCLSTVQTEFGSVYFDDGVQTWINPRYISSGSGGR